MKASRGLKSSSNSSSKIGRHRKRIGTPGVSGIEFEAISVGHEGGNLADATETFSYEDVSNLATVTPVAARPGKGAVSKASSRASEAGGQAKGKVGNGKLPEDTHEETSTEEEESGAVRRRKQRLRQKAAAAAVTVEAGAATATVASLDDREQPENPNGNASNGSDQRNNNRSSIANSSVESNANGNWSNGFATGNHAEAAAADGNRNITAAERRTGETGEEAAPTSGGGKRKKRRGQIRAASTAQQAPKIPRYPRVSLTPSGNAKCLADALEEAVSSELEGFLRKRGKTAACKAAVDAAVDAMQEIRRQASDIGVELDPFPGDMKFLRKVFDEERRRQRSRIDEEERLFAAEEQKLLALAERNKQAQSAQANNCKAVDLSENEAGGAGARLSSSGVTTQEDGFFETRDDPEGEEVPPVDSNIVGAAKRVGDQLLASTNDMLLNAGAIGRCLQEMGAGFADAQEAKERLGRAYKQFAFRNYPNVNDPKSLIASMLQ